MQEHRWIGKRQGGPPDMAESSEWIEFCDLFGMERPPEGENEPPCEGAVCLKDGCRGKLELKGDFLNAEGGIVYLQQCDTCKDAMLV